MMAFLRSIARVSGGSGVFGIMRPLKSTVRGDETRAPPIHCRQLKNWVVDGILKDRKRETEDMIT